MSLVPYTITALERDVADADSSGKQIIIGAVCSMFIQPSNAVVLMYDDAAGSNGSTAKTTNLNGQAVVYVSTGTYRVSVNGQNSFVYIAGKDDVSRVIDLTLPLLHLFAPNDIQKTLAGVLTKTRATTATYIDRYGTLKAAAIDELRVNEKGALREGAGTNLFASTTDGTQWDKSNVTVTTASDDRYGSVLSVTQNLSGTNILFEGVIPATNTVITTYAVIKPDPSRDRIRITHNRCKNPDETILRNASATFIFATLTVTGNTDISGYNNTFEDLGGGYYAISLTTNVFADAVQQPNTHFYFDNALATEGPTLVCIPQCEESPFATSHIPTAGSPATRAADDLSGPVYNNLPPLSKPWTISLSFIFNGLSSGNNVIFGLGNGNERLIVTQSGKMFIRDLTGSHELAGVGAVQAQSAYKFALTFDGTNCIAYINGSANPDAPCSFLDVDGVIRIGKSIFGEAANISIANFRTFDRALTEDEVKLL